MISFPLFLLVLAIVMITFYMLGFKHGHSHGHDCGWDAGYEFATTDSEIRWQLTAKGEAAASATEHLEMIQRQALADLHVHPSFLESNR